MGEAPAISVEVCYATLDRQVLIGLEVDASATVEQAIRSSGILQRFPEIDLTVNKVGIFSKLCDLEHGVREGDRIEIYRPLRAAPQDIRRNRASAQSGR